MAGKVALNIIFEVAQLLLKSLPSHQDKNAQTIPYLWPKWPNSIPYLSCQNGWKTVPFEAAHTYIAHIRKYPFRALISKPKRPVRVSSLCTAAPPLRGTSETRAQETSAAVEARMICSLLNRLFHNQKIKVLSFIRCFILPITLLKVVWKRTFTFKSCWSLFGWWGQAVRPGREQSYQIFYEIFWLLLEFRRELSAAYFLTRVFSTSLCI